MQAGEQYGLLPNMQPFDTSRGSPHLFYQLQNIPCVSQIRSNVSLLREHVPWLHLPPPPQQHQYQGELHSLQQEPVNQALDIQHQHFLDVQATHPPIVQQLPPHSHCPEISTSIAATPSSIQLKQFAATPLGSDAQAAIARGTSSNRWFREDAATLVKLRSEMDASLRDSGFRGSLWEEVLRLNEAAGAKDSQLEDGDGSVHLDEKLHEIGYHRSAIKSHEKFENVQNYHKRTDCTKSRMQDGKHYRSLSELDAVCTENIKEDDVDGRDSGDSSCGGVGGTSTGKGHGGDAIERGGVSAANTGDVPIRKPHATYSAINLSSDSSEEEHAWSDDVDEQDSAKRKRKSRSSPSRVFFETFTRRILRQQEVLHKKFLKTLEERDLERIRQEEEYRRQEAARLNREQELRVQDLAVTAARDAALLEFLEKSSGHAFQFPKMNTQSIPSNAAFSDVQADANGKLAGGAEINTKRWLKVEVRALIRLRSGMDPRFQEAGPKAHLWQEIAASMASMGFIRSPKRCKEKWENINKYFKKTKGSCRKRPENAKTCPYFQQLDTLYRRGILPSSSGKFSRLDSLSENLLESNTENDGLCRNENSLTDVLAIVPVRQSSSDSAQVTSTTALKFQTGTEVNPETDLGAQEASQTKIQSDTFTHLRPAAACSQMDNLQAVEETCVTKRSIQMEMFVKDILELQQQQHQRLVDEYERLRQPRELTEFETQCQMNQSVPASAHEQSHTNTVNDTNADLMALVHKLAGDSSDLTMSAPSSME